MKRMRYFLPAAALVLSFSALAPAQEATTTPEKKPATMAEHKPMMEQKSTLAVKLTKDEITALQNALSKARVYKGKANGTLDTATQEALREYQKSNKLTITGEPDHETLHKLGIYYAAWSKKSATPAATTTKPSTPELQPHQ